MICEIYPSHCESRHWFSVPIPLASQQHQLSLSIWLLFATATSFLSQLRKTMRRHSFVNACVDGAKNAHTEGVAGVLRHVVPDATITVEEFHPVWVAVDSTEPMPLGEHCVLGGGFFDRGNCVKVVIVPVTPSAVRSLMPGQPRYEDVVQMLRLYLGYEAQAVLHVHMHVQPALMPSPVLEPQSMSLGYTAMLPFEKAHGGYREPVRVQLGVWNRPCGG